GDRPHLRRPGFPRNNGICWLPRKSARGNRDIAGCLRLRPYRSLSSHSMNALLTTTLRNQIATVKKKWVFMQSGRAVSRAVAVLCCTFSPRILHTNWPLLALGGYYVTPAAIAPRSLTARYEAEFATSRKLYDQAKNLFPNGV